MPKRKRDAATTESPRDPTKNLEVQKRIVQKKLLQGKRALSRALKQSKRHEHQRLGKRISRAKSGDGAEQVARLEREADSLKVLDLSELAEAHLRRSISKSKDLSTALALSDYNATTSTQANGITEDAAALAKSNVTARLYNSKHVKDELAIVLTSIRKVLGSGDATKSGRAAKKGHRPEHVKDAPYDGSTRAVDPSGTEDRDISNRRAASPNPVASKEPERWRSIEDGNDQNRRQASHSPAPSSATSRSTLEEYQMNRGGGMVNGGVDRDTIMDDEEFYPSEAEPRTTKPSVPAGTKAKKKALAPSSTFLPSLMAGGYWSGSESAEDLPEMQPRKNRRGQRARRQIWEMKYGHNANHVKRAVREDGWDPRRGARESRRERDPSPWRDPSYIRRPTSTIAANNTKHESEPASKPEPDRPLHPSWEAAREAKKRKEAAKFQGQKMVFD